MKLLKAAMLCLLLPLSLFARADNPSDQLTFHYSGNVVVPACTVALANYVIDFGNINVETLENTDSGTDWKQIHLILSDCTDVNTISVTLSENASAENTSYFASTGTAKHVAVELFDLGLMSVLHPGQTHSQQINGAPGIDWNYQVRIVNDGSGMATSGTVDSTITVNYEFK